MASGASATAATATVAVFAIMVLSSLGHPVPDAGPLCSDCGLLCTRNCTEEIFNSCSTYCNNPAANTQQCERQVFQACTLQYCCNGNCSLDCDLEAKKCNVHDTTFDCQNCKGGILQSCIPACNSNCNSTCVKKEDGC